MVTRADLSIYINALGNIAPPNAPQLATQPGENRKSIMVLFAIPEEDVQAVIRKRDANQPLPVDLYNREMNKKIGRGSLVGVDNQIDTQTGTLQCKAAVVPVDDTLLYPNLFVNVRMLMETRRDVVQVSAAAIQRDANDSFVFVMQPDQTVVTRSVGLGAIGGDNIEITSGLSPGDIVVVDGADRLRSGSKISLSPMPAN
jgi:multidrug efflux system membrane fusion protein